MLQIDLGDLQIHRGLVNRFVLGVQQAQGVGLVTRAQARLLAARGVLAVINAVALKQFERCFHVMPFGSEA